MIKRKQFVDSRQSVVDVPGRICRHVDEIAAPWGSGSDFTARWNEGAWAEQQILGAINRVPGFFAVQYGITDGEAFWSTRDMDARELPDQARYGKRPDILVFSRADLTLGEVSLAEKVYQLADGECEVIVKKASLAIESEFSPYNYAYRVENYGKELSFTVKDEDLEPIKRWRSHFGVEIGIVQIFLDCAYILSVKLLLAGIKNGTIPRKYENSYGKYVYYPPMSRGIVFGAFTGNPAISAELILDRYGKYTAYRKVAGGELQITKEARSLLISPGASG